MNLLKLLFMQGSRKVGFGLWLFIVANIYLVMKLLTSDQWFLCVSLTSALIGGGTWLDKKLSLEEKKSDASKKSDI